jgi:hypothetical protein
MYFYPHRGLQVSPPLLLIMPDFIPEQHEEGLKMGPNQRVGMQKSGINCISFGAEGEWILAFERDIILLRHTLIKRSQKRKVCVYRIDTKPLLPPLAEYEIHESQQYLGT